jgi:hypothetical protein
LREPMDVLPRDAEYQMAERRREDADYQMAERRREDAKYQMEHLRRTEEMNEVVQKALGYRSSYRPHVWQMGRCVDCRRTNPSNASYIRYGNCTGEWQP